jgi:hypothetical protein
MIPRHVAVKLVEEAIRIIEEVRFPTPSGWLVNAAKLDRPRRAESWGL